MSVKKNTILIIDDFPIARKHLINSLMEIDEFQIIEAETSYQALDVLAKEEISIIISDWNMPEINGIDLVKIIRSNAETKEIPIVMIGSESQKQLFLETLEDHLTGYLMKPFSLAKVKESIHSLGK